jgi:hypothetical protein
MTEIVDVTTIRTLNDRFRQSLRGGMLVMTAGVIALGQERQLKILEAVARFDRFDEDNDPYGEHDFGALEIEGERLFFKIDYYDQSLSAHSPDPADEGGRLRRAVGPLCLRVQGSSWLYLGSGVFARTSQPLRGKNLCYRLREPAELRNAIRLR